MNGAAIAAPFSLCGRSVMAKPAGFVAGTLPIPQDGTAFRLGHGGLDEDLLQPPERAAADEDRDGAGVEVVVAVVHGSVQEQEGPRAVCRARAGRDGAGCGCIAEVANSEAADQLC